MVMLPTAAFAQTTPDQTTPDQTNPNEQQPAVQAPAVPGEPNKTKKADQGAIVITGVRRAIQDSIQIKRRETSMVEAVSAEEIGKLPDNSIAESIARLPGLAAQRVAGRAQIISVRGFSPDFTTVLLNGRQQASSGYNRAVEFDQYPSELLGSVVVYKTPDADIAGQGLAGTVDLRTIRPLEYGKRAIALNLRGELDQGGGRNHDFSKYGWRGSASWIGQNEDGTLGWLLGYAHLDAPGHIDHTKNWFYDNYAGLLPDGSPYFLSGQEAIATNSRDIRDGVMGTLEWKPSDFVHSVLDLYYSRFKQHTVNRGAEWFSDAWVDGTTYSNFNTETVGGTTFATSGHVDNVVPILMYQDNKRTDHLFSAGLNNDFRIADRTHLYADLSYSSNTRDESYLEAYGGYGVGPFQTRTFDSYNFQIPDAGFPQFTGFGLNYADANQVSLGDRAPWGGWGHDGLLKTPHIKETLGSGDLTLKQDIGGEVISSVELGLDFTHRHKTKTVGELDLFLKNDRMETLVDPQFLTDPISLSFAGMGPVLGVDIASALPTYYDEVQLQDANHFDKSWGIKEDIATLKAKANIDFQGLHGNIGLQVVRQHQDSQGLRINTAVSPIQLIPVDEATTYTDVLPSLNLYYDLDPRSRIRFAAAKVMMRPRMDDMRANLVPGFNGSVCVNALPPCAPGTVVHPWSASGGNPDLKPWRATEFDAAYEWYGGRATYFSVNAFYFFLDNWIYNQLSTADFSGITPPPDQLAVIPPGVVVSPIGSVDMPANGTGGWIGGVELSGAIEFGRIAHFLDGFGAEGSVSRSKYYLPPQALLQYTNGALPGFSKWTYNLTGYYEKNGFQARASYRYRDKFQGEVVALFTNLGYTYILADKQMDAQVGYTFQPGSRLNGLGILLQVNNLLNSPYSTSYTVNGVERQEIYEKYGRQYFLGLSYHF
jgi:iron complex outermembrane receptor protein